MSGLPATWEEVTLGTVAEFIMGQAPPGSESNFDGSGTPFVKAGEFGAERPIIREWTTKPLKFACESDILICVVGATCGKVNLGADCAIGRSVAAIRPNANVDHRYLYSYLKTMVGHLRHGATGSAQGAISRETLSEIKLPFSPLAEQHRIVGKIGSLFGKSKRARDDLDHIPRLVDKYKQALLTAAFGGRLTRRWRLKNPTASGEPLLRELRNRRLTHRRSNIPTRNLIDVQSLPAQWPVARIEDIAAEVVDGTHHTPDYVPDGVPFISAKDIRNGLIDFSDCRHISSASHNELARRCLPIGGRVDHQKRNHWTLRRCSGQAGI